MDVDSREILREVAGYKGRINGTPVIDLDRGRLYFYTIGALPEDPDRSGVWTHYVYQVNLDGTDMHGFEVRIGDIARRNYPAALHDA